MCDSSYETIGILLSLLIHAQASSHGLGQWQNCLPPCHMHLIACTYWRVYVAGEKQTNKPVTFETAFPEKWGERKN